MHTHRFELPVDPAGVDRATALLWAAGALGLWERPGSVVAWFAERVTTVPPGGVWSHEPDRDWQAAWRRTIQPVRAGSITVVPTWLAGDSASSGSDPDALTIVLDPGRAFGSGHHATTLLCLELLDATPLAGRRVADIGCGSGILAIAAALRGAHAVAVDLDPVAVEVTRANALRNGAEVDARHGSIEQVTEPAAVVVANLLTDTILDLAPRLVAATTDVLVVSGIGSARSGAVEGALEAAGAQVTTVRERDGWVAVAANAARRPPTADRDVHRHGTASGSGSDRSDRRG